MRGRWRSSTSGSTRPNCPIVVFPRIIRDFGGARDIISAGRLNNGLSLNCCFILISCSPFSFKISIQMTSSFRHKCWFSSAIISRGRPFIWIGHRFRGLGFAIVEVGQVGVEIRGGCRGRPQFNQITFGVPSLIIKSAIIFQNRALEKKGLCTYSLSWN